MAKKENRSAGQAEDGLGKKNAWLAIFHPCRQHVQWQNYSIESINFIVI